MITDKQPEMMRPLTLAMLMVPLLADCAASPGTSARPDRLIQGRAVEAAMIFAQFCLDAPPSFGTIDQAATRSGFPVFMDRPIAPGAQQKTWILRVTKEEKPLLLSVEGGPSADGKDEVTVCGIAATDARGLDLEHALSVTRQLGRPVKRVDHLPSGGKAVYWTALFGTSPANWGEVMLAYDVPGLAVNPINITYKRPR